MRISCSGSTMILQERILAIIVGVRMLLIKVYEKELPQKIFWEDTVMIKLCDEKC